MLTQHRSAMSSSLIGERTTESLDEARSAARRVVEDKTSAATDRRSIFGQPA